MYQIVGVSSLGGFVKLKKNPRKTRKWVGGASPNSDLFFFFEMLCFLCCFHVQMFQKKNLEWGRGVWVLSDQSDFFSNFWIFFLLDKTPEHVINKKSQTRNGKQAPLTRLPVKMTK